MGLMKGVVMVLGVLQVLKLLYLVWTYVKVMFFSERINLRERYGDGVDDDGDNKFHKRKNPWAVITGASSGIGAEFAKDLAKKGFNTMLVARRKPLLEEISEEIRHNNPDVECKILPFDLATLGDEGVLGEFVSNVKDITGNKPIKVLILNASIAVLAKHFTDIPLSKNLEVLNLGSASSISLLQGLMPSLLSVGTENAEKSDLKRKKSLVITCGALNSTLISPVFSIVASNKHFLRCFMKSVAMEFKDEIDVMYCVPLAVKSGIVKASTLSVESAEEEKELRKGLGVHILLTSEEFAHNVLMDCEKGRKESYGSLLQEICIMRGFWLLQLFLGEEYVARFFLNGVKRFSIYLKQDVDLRDPRTKLSELYKQGVKKVE